MLSIRQPHTFGEVRVQQVPAGTVGHQGTRDADFVAVHVSRQVLEDVRVPQLFHQHDFVLKRRGCVVGCVKSTRSSSIGSVEDVSKKETRERTRFTRSKRRIVTLSANFTYRESNVSTHFRKRDFAVHTQTLEYGNVRALNRLSCGKSRR